MKKKLANLFMVGMMLTLAACGSNTEKDASSTAQPAAQETKGEPKQWAMGTSSSGSSPYVMGGAISKLINEKQTAIKLSPQVTGGYEENLSLVSKGTVHIAQATLDQINDVYAGKGRYEGKAQKDVRALFNAALMPIHVASLDGSEVASDQDLKGKKFNIASPKQASYTLAVKYLDSLGMSVDDIKPGHLSTKDAPGALKDNQQDAIFVVSTLPLPGLVEVAVSKPIHLLPIEGALAEKYIEAAEGALIKTTIPANTYNGVKEDVNTVASPMTLYVNEKASEDEVYQFTKTFWGNLDVFAKDFPAAASMTKEMAVQGITAPLHPGAEKYFKEIGIIK